jgi:TatD DNase family protein
MIDSHCHLYSDQYDHDLEQVVRRAGTRLSAIVISAVDVESLEKSLAIRRKYPDLIYVSAGVHPREAAELTNEDRQKLWKTIRHVRHEIVAVGEVGPDFHHIQDTQKHRRQLLLLEEALSIAEEWNLPLVVHARRAEPEALEVLSQSRTPVMFHCFNGSKDIARKIAGHGFYLSFSALLLASVELREVVKEIPLEKILTETDSPALSPRFDTPRNEPVFVETIVSCIARLLGFSREKAAELTAANARRFYGLP